MTDRLLTARLHAGPGGIMSRVPPEVMAVVMGTDPSYLSGVFETIEAQDGSVAAYLQVRLGVGPAALTALRDNLLE